MTAITEEKFNKVNGGTVFGDTEDGFIIHDFKVGDRVYWIGHEYMGVGRVIKVMDGYCTVLFEKKVFDLPIEIPKDVKKIELFKVHIL